MIEDMNNLTKEEKLVKAFNDKYGIDYDRRGLWTDNYTDVFVRFYPKDFEVVKMDFEEDNERDMTKEELEKHKENLYNLTDTVYNFLEKVVKQVEDEYDDSVIFLEDNNYVDVWEFNHIKEEDELLFFAIRVGFLKNEETEKVIKLFFKLLKKALGSSFIDDGYEDGGVLFRELGIFEDYIEEVEARFWDEKVASVIDVWGLGEEV